jgi:mono/diheme cytochrome c family protein
MQMKIHIRTIALVIAIGLPALGPISAQEASQTTASGSGREADAQLIDKGKSLYAHYCSRCHGPNMVTPGTAVYDLRQFPHEQKGRFIQSVARGKNDRMPAWGDVLGQDDLESLWAYVIAAAKAARTNRDLSQYSRSALLWYYGANATSLAAYSFAFDPVHP